jgi:hypothetical protein
MPCSPSKVNRHFGGKSRATCFMLGLFFTLKMKVTVSSKMSGDFPWTTQHYIPEDTTLHNHHGENLYIFGHGLPFPQCYKWMHGTSRTPKNYQSEYWMNTLLNLLRLCFGESKVDLGAINITVDNKPILKCLIFGLFYFHLTTGFDLSRSSSGGFYNYMLLLESHRFNSHRDYWMFRFT